MNPPLSNKDHKEICWATGAAATIEAEVSVTTWGLACRNIQLICNDCFVPCKCN